MFLNASKTPKFSDDPTELNCRITNAQDTEANIRFTVSWYYRQRLRSDDVVTEELLATMDADWTLLLGDRSRERTQNGEIIFSKKTADIFSLRIQWTSESDRGDYFCVISAWSRHRNNSWVKSKDVTSASVNIFWATQGRNLAPVCWKTWIAEIVFSWVGPSARKPAIGLWKWGSVLWKGKNTTTLCKGLLFVEGSNYLTPLTILCNSSEWKCKAEIRQSNRIETSRSWAVIVAGVASSSDAGVIAPFHDSGVFWSL